MCRFKFHFALSWSFTERKLISGQMISFMQEMNDLSKGLCEFIDQLLQLALVVNVSWDSLRAKGIGGLWHR